MTLVAIHQPNFLPWLGFFDKLAKADRFIILDTVPLQLTGGNYTNRVRMLISGAAAWISVPIERGRSARERIHAAKTAEVIGWRKKVKRSIQQSYSRAPYFAAGMAIVDRVLDANTEFLCEMNMIGIRAIANALDLDTQKIVRASDLAGEGQSTELLANLVEALNGTGYLTGHGAGGYQDDAEFKRRGIAVQYQNYQAPAYPQYRINEFISGLSAIDAIMNCGPGAAMLVGQFV